MFTQLVINRQILVIGAGMAGLAAAHELCSRGFQVTVLEARDRPGGRIWTNQVLGLPIDLGASWIHRVEGNPITALAGRFGVRTLATDEADVRIYQADGRPLSEGETERLEQQFLTFIEEVEGIGKSTDEDISIGEAVRRVMNLTSLSNLAKSYFDWKLANFELDMAADLSSLSLLWSGDDDEFTGEDRLFPGGYVQLVNSLAQGLDIRLNHVVIKIEISQTGVQVTTNQGLFTAERAVVTLPLGVLKQGVVHFSPPLPERKLAAIGRLRMGVLNKVVLSFPTCFWPEDRHYLGYLAATAGTIPLFLNMFPFVDSPILVGFIAGRSARAIEGYNNTAIIKQLMNVLQSMFGDKVRQPMGSVVTRWHSDPFAGGSYSFIPFGASGADYDAIAEPVGERLFFAGEASNRRYCATVHGAFLSGIREAERISHLTD